MAYAGPPRPPDRGPFRLRRPAGIGAGIGGGVGAGIGGGIGVSLRTPPRPAPPTTPRPTTPPTPDYLSQAAGIAQAQIDPILRNIANQYNAQALATRNAIGTVTSQYAGALGRYASGVGAPYSQAISTVKGASQGVSGMLTQAGKTAAATETAALAASHLPVNAAGPDVNPQGLTAEGKGAAAAAGAIGQAMINALQAEQKAALEYAGKLPGFATQEGQQQTNLALASLASEMAKQMADTTAQVPQLTYQIYQDLQDRADRDKEFAGNLWENGLLTQREYAQKIGLPDWQKYPALTKQQLEAVSQPHKITLTTGYGGHRLRIDETTGQVTDLGLAGAPKQPSPPHLTIKNIGGRAVAIDPVTLRKTDLGPWGSPKAQAAATAAKILGPGGAPLTSTQVNTLAGSYNPSQIAKIATPIPADQQHDLIYRGALRYGLDPQAVLAVASAEGLGAGAGDGGTSFGPFQLHIGGALPRGKDEAWANSPAGIDYALRQIARVAGGKTGVEAISAIVRGFERPADPAAEIRRAAGTYGTFRAPLPPKQTKASGSAVTDQTGTAPRRVAPGKWVTQSGKPLSPAGNAYWENMWRTHRTDGRGKIYPPKSGTGTRSSSGSSTSASDYFG